MVDEDMSCVPTNNLGPISAVKSQAGSYSQDTRGGFSTEVSHPVSSVAKRKARDLTDSEDAIDPTPLKMVREGIHDGGRLSSRSPIQAPSAVQRCFPSRIKNLFARKMISRTNKAKKAEHKRDEKYSHSWNGVRDSEVEHGEGTNNVGPASSTPKDDMAEVDIGFVSRDHRLYMYDGTDES